MVEGKRRKTHLFRCVLSHSRKGYSEAVWRQTSESFIRCLENAFRHFGGVTATVVIDNLKAGVSRGPQSLRVMQGLLHLAEKHPVAELEKAARIATHHGTWRLRDLKRLLELPGNVVQLDFLETHPLIRSLEAYRIEPAAHLNPNPTP